MEDPIYTGERLEVVYLPISGSAVIVKRMGFVDD
jgi:hypothetical protein